jgi:DNA-binding GntR family transcriptional regulator
MIKTKPPARSTPARAPAPLTATTPRYQVVAQALMRDIESGRYKVGDLMPTETQLCAQFGVSRHTAREAARRLVEAGLLVRRAGVGTTVKATTRVQGRYAARVSDLSELFAFNRETRFELLSEDSVVVDDDLADLLPGSEGQRWARFTVLRHAPGAQGPIVHTHILMRPGYEAVRDRIGEPGVMVHELIEQLHGERISELRQEISCVRTPRAMARLLGTRPGSPALRVVRCYVGADDSPLSVAINTYPEERFKLTTRWRLDQDGR